MKINMMLIIVSFAFFSFLGMIIGEHLYDLKMADNGLQQCVVQNKVIWAKICN